MSSAPRVRGRRHGSGRVSVRRNAGRATPTFRIHRIRRKLIVEDRPWTHWCEHGQARTAWARAGYLAAYLLPGIFAYVLINVASVFRAGVDLFGADPLHYQYVLFVLFTWLWHLALPVAMLRWRDGLAWRDVAAFLGLHRFRLREPLLVAPLALQRRCYFRCRGC